MTDDEFRMAVKAEFPITWQVPLVGQGQTIERSFASLRDGRVAKRVEDRSTGEVEFYTADAADCGCPRECNCFDNPTKVGYYWKLVKP
jgi:hypothetical protein